MSFDNLAAEFRKRAEKRGPAAEAAATDFGELHLVRARILGLLIRDARQIAGLTLEVCAERVRVSAEILADWELGEVMPSLPEIELLAHALGVPISYFWGVELMQKQARSAVDAGEYAALRDRLIGVALRTARESANLTQEALAAASGLTPTTIAAYEVGQRPIPLPVLVTLASAVRVNLAYFLENGNRVGHFLLLQEDLKRFSALPEELRQFVAQPVNQPYLDLARRLAQMGTAELRSVAEAILEITF